MYLPGTRPYRGAWQETSATAEQYNKPGRFTAFIGYEWTSNTGGNNLHRNVIFRDNSDKTSQVEPFTVYPSLGSDNPAELWKWMEAYQDKTGGSVLAIAHNGNLSNGLMFPPAETFGKKIDGAYAETRAKWERLYEATQTKAMAKRIRSRLRTTSSPKAPIPSAMRWPRSRVVPARRHRRARCRERLLLTGGRRLWLWLWLWLRPRQRHHALGRNRLLDALRRLCRGRAWAALRVRHDPARADLRYQSKVLEPVEPTFMST